MSPATGVGFALTVSFWLGALGGPSSAAQAQRFETRIEVVKLSVLVRGPEGPVLGLRAVDFEVRDRGVLQRVESVLFEESPLNVILAFDVSGSVKGEKLSELKRAAHGLVDALRPGDQAALLTFADALRLDPRLGSDLAPIRSRIDHLDAEGGTSLMDGTFAAMILGDVTPGRMLAVVFTDGQETVSWLREADVIDAARRSEVVVYGVRAGREAPRFLDRVASTTGGRMLEAESSDRLRQAFLEILTEFRTRYLLSYTPRGVGRKGWHRLDVRVKGRSAKVLTRKGYLVTP